jgi:hypothetical protein
MGLALHIGLAGFTLRIERVEGEIEVMFGRFCVCRWGSAWASALTPPSWPALQTL